MKNLKEFLYPKSIEDIKVILNDKADNAMLLAGGTALAFSKNTNVDTLVDISNANLSYIKEENENILIGCMTTLDFISKNELINKIAGGMLTNACKLAGTQLIRNKATIGGSLYYTVSWSDIPAALIAIESKVKIIGKEEKIIQIDSFLEKAPRKILSSNEFIKEIIIPKKYFSAEGFFYKLSKTKADYNIVDIAFSFFVENNKYKNLRIATSHGSILPARINSVEAYLENKEISEENINKSFLNITNDLKPVDTIRASKEYKLEIIENLLKENLTKISRKYFS